MCKMTKVIGVGGSGIGVVDLMIEKGLAGVDFLAFDLDRSELERSHAGRRMPAGPLYAMPANNLYIKGSVEAGAKAAEENRDEIISFIGDASMLFVIAGMGGGAGTGAAPVIAGIAKEAGVLTVAMATRPCLFEGRKRTRLAEDGIKKLKENADALISIPGENMFHMTAQTVTLPGLFSSMDIMLASHYGQIIDSVNKLIHTEGVINLDLDDVASVIKDCGDAVISVGRASGEKRAALAACAALLTPLPERTLDGAGKLLLSIAGGANTELPEIIEINEYITNAIDREKGDCIWGYNIDESLGDSLEVMLIATNFDSYASGRAGNAIREIREASE